MREIQSLYSLNRGVISPLGLARLDVKRLALAAEDQTNWMPRALGPMALRAGLKYLGSTYANSASKLVRFIFSTDDVALLELTPGLMRIWSQDALLTRPSVATAITNGTFASNINGWTDLDDAGATSSWTAPNYMQLVGTGTARAIREQAVTCANVGIEHGIRITIARGPVTLRIGSTSGADDYIAETTLYTGTHSLSITPTGTFYIRFESRLERKTWVSGCTIEAAGVVTIPTPWQAADLDHVRYDQSADVVFVACDGIQQRRIERRGTRPHARGFSVVLYQSDNGPFEIQNLTPTTLTPSAISGNITVTASVPTFDAGHVGALFAITSIGQTVNKVGTANGDFTTPIRVVGILTDRTFSIVISG